MHMQSPSMVPNSSPVPDPLMYKGVAYIGPPYGTMCAVGSELHKQSDQREVSNLNQSKLTWRSSKAISVGRKLSVY